jgi:hypothetical protein
MAEDDSAAGGRPSFGRAWHHPSPASHDDRGNTMDAFSGYTVYGLLIAAVAVTVVGSALWS